MFVPQRVEDAVAVLVHEARDVVVHLARVVRNPELVGGARGAVEAVILGECVLELGVKEGRRGNVLEQHGVRAVADANLVGDEGEEAAAAVLQHVQDFLGGVSVCDVMWCGVV